MISILVPTIKSVEQLGYLLNELKSKSLSNPQIVVSTSPSSVAININRGLDKCKGSIIIKVDDDISGFDHGWDIKLIEPLVNSENVKLVAARLLNPDGSVQVTCSRDVNIQPRIVSPIRPLVPFCCVALKRDQLRMDERYQGSGYDDTDYCNQLRVKYKTPTFLINNEVRLFHRNESKNAQFEKNRALFIDKWRNTVFADGKGLVE